MSPSPKSDGPDVKPVDITPTLLSSPELDSHLVQHSDRHPSVNSLNVGDSQHDLGKCGSVSSVGGLIPLRATKYTRTLTLAKQNMRRETV
jgi:hypothetical protein